MSMHKSDKIFVAGHRGLVGSAILRRLRADGYGNLLTRERSQLDLTDTKAVNDLFAKEKPSVVVLAAAKVGGIKANNDFPV
ncbi:MAG TPA: NAD-dependent epimerase/dehydratase family protein, partial [Chthoniobacterales bacterium]|nr:NAD-dependent epimerase/dehydratase family protein [Chthoniobacterales bacterium]